MLLLIFVCTGPGVRLQPVQLFQFLNMESSLPWTVFHQKEELTTRIHNILQEYPPSIGPFKEFVQNADDAGARSFSLMLDEENYATNTLFSDKLSVWQGPSLLVFNDSIF